MPELPEVETLKRELSDVIIGKKIADVFCNSPKQLTPKLAEFKKAVVGKKIIAVKRRAKVLIIDLEGEQSILIHLKMTGQLIFKRQETSDKRQSAGDKGQGIIAGGHPQRGGLDDLPNKFTHIYLNFTDGTMLYFNDMRKFGWMRLANDNEVNNLVEELGVEPLSKNFTLEKFLEILKRRQNKKIKQVLMEQELIAGIGNIYADESLFCAKILPTRPVKKLKPAEIKKLFICIPEILEFAITKKGTSMDTYVQLTGEPGNMVPHLKVYGREGEKCKTCGNIIQKIKFNGRGTHFCPKCQK